MKGSYLILAVGLIIGWFAGFVSRGVLPAPKHIALNEPTICHAAKDGSIWCPSAKEGTTGEIRVAPPKLPPGMTLNTPLTL